MIPNPVYQSATARRRSTGLKSRRISQKGGFRHEEKVDRLVAKNAIAFSRRGSLGSQALVVANDSTSTVSGVLKEVL